MQRAEEDTFSVEIFSSFAGALDVEINQITLTQDESKKWLIHPCGLLAVSLPERFTRDPFFRRPLGYFFDLFGRRLFSVFSIVRVGSVCNVGNVRSVFKLL